jgi:uncharacterized iron-regulated protein
MAADTTCGAVLLILATAGCSASPQGARVGDATQSYREDPPPPPPPDTSREEEDTVEADVVEQAARPFHGFRTSDRQVLTERELLRDLALAELICFGEDHSDVSHHYAELAVFQELVDRAELSGRELALGLEMFEVPMQPVLDRYSALKIDEQGLRRRVRWKKSWGHPFAYYRPLLELARRERKPIVGLNAPRSLVKKVAREGLDALDNDEVAALPALDFTSSAHQAAFDRSMKQHPHTGSDPDNLYAAQLVRDETMAATAASFLGVRVPARQMLVIAGAGHCRKSAIVARTTRRLPIQALAVVPIAADAEQDLAASAEGFDYAIVLGEK